MKLTVGGAKKGARLGKQMSKSERGKKVSASFVTPSSKAASKRLEESGKAEFWKPQDGLNRVYILPTTEDMAIDGSFPWAETKGHYVGGKDVMDALGIERPDDFPMVHGCADFHEKRPCRYCRFMAQLKKSKKRADKRLGGALYAGLQCFANIVDLKAPKVVRPYRFGQTVRSALLAAIEGDNIFCDPDDLLEVQIRRRKKGRREMDVEYIVTVKSRRHDVSPVSVKDKWVSQLRDLTEFIPDIPTEEEAEEVIEQLLAEADVDDDDDLDSLGDDDDDNDDLAF